MSSDKELEAYFNDHTGKVDAPKPASAMNDADLEAYLNDKTGNIPSPAQGPNIVDRLKGMAVKALPQAQELGSAIMAPEATIMNKGPEMVQRASNFIQGKPNVPAQTLLEAAGNRPDITAQGAVGLIPGVTPISMAARVAGSAAGAALNPDNRGKNAATAGGLQAVLEALPYGAGKVAPAMKAIMSKASGVDAKAIQQLFENPALLWTGPSMQEARQLYSATAQKLGLSAEVSDNVLFDSGKKFVRNTLDAIKAGDEVPTQTLLDARQTTSDLIEAAKRSGKMNKVKGFTQRYQDINEAIASQAPELRTADATFSKAATRDQFMNPLPMNQNGTPSVAKTVIGGVAGVLPALAMSPFLQGTATSAAGAVAKAAPAARTGLQVLRQYILNQRPNGR